MLWLGLLAGMSGTSLRWLPRLTLLSLTACSVINAPEELASSSAKEGTSSGAANTGGASDNVGAAGAGAAANGGTGMVGTSGDGPGEAGQGGGGGLACEPGLSDCGECVDLQTDSLHCGQCGNTCGAELVCEAGECVVPCEDSLIDPVVDAWGNAWDGQQREASDLVSAGEDCASGRARLPVATELYRVSANPSQSGSVGQSNDTSFLWSRTPRDAQHIMSARLSDGAINLQPSATINLLPYRCTCAPTAPEAFTGSACNGPKDEECFALVGANQRYNIDRADRAPLPKSAAIWECQQSGAHLAEYLMLVEAIQADLLGSGNWLHTADDAHYAYSTGLRFLDEGASWVPVGNTTVLPLTTGYGFRCAGLNYVAGISPVQIDNRFDEGPNGYSSHTEDEEPASFAIAHDACFERGGHLARSAELGALINKGLPNGSAVYLWTADAVGFAPSGGQFLNMAILWDGELSIFPYYYTGAALGTSWQYKSTPSNLYRCVYYPVDSEFQPPVARDCNGGCFELVVGDGPATMWFDQLDRAPATPEAAIKNCQTRGGRLPSERDFTEAIRNGLPKGSEAWLHTADIGFGDANMTGILYDIVVRWKDTNPTYNALYPTYMTWAGLGAAYPYRCMWTNELR
jgi:hypothetical protein